MTGPQQCCSHLDICGQFGKCIYQRGVHLLRGAGKTPPAASNKESVPREDVALRAALFAAQVADVAESVERGLQATDANAANADLFLVMDL